MCVRFLLTEASVKDIILLNSTLGMPLRFSTSELVFAWLGHVSGDRVAPVAGAGAWLRVTQGCPGGLGPEACGEGEEELCMCEDV